MKIDTLFIWILVLMTFGCNSKKSVETGSGLSDNKGIVEIQKDRNNYFIQGKSAGDFTLGESINLTGTSNSYTIKKEIQKRMTEEGMEEETVYVVNEAYEKLLLIKTVYDFESDSYSDKIDEIGVVSHKYKTLEGIGVNSTIDEFINQYPNFKIWYTYVSEMYVIETKEIDAQFILSGSDLLGEINATSDITELKKSDFKHGAAIIKIRII